MAYRWPELTVMDYTNFLELARGYNYICRQPEDVDDVWKRWVEVVTGSAHTVASAKAQTLTYEEIGRAVLGGREQFPRISDRRWKIMLVLGLRVCSELPAYRKNARSYDMLKDFVVRNRYDSRAAARIWTVLVQDGLGMFLGSLELAKMYWVPTSAICAIADDDPALHRNLGRALVPILRAWRRTF